MFKFLNIAGQRQEIIFSGSSGEIGGLAKIAAASSVQAVFSLTGYNTKTVTLHVSPQSNPVKLSKITTGSNAVLNINVAPVDTLKSEVVIP